MRKMISRAAVAILIAIGCCLGTGAAWADTPDATGTLGSAQSNAATWSYYASTNTVEISGGVIECTSFSQILWGPLFDYIDNNNINLTSPVKLVMANGVNSVTLRGIMNGMFSYFDLSELDLSKFDVSGVTEASGMFRETTGLQTIDISGWNLSNATDLSFMIVGNEGVTAIDMSGVTLPQQSCFVGMIVDNPDLTTVYASSGTDWSGCRSMPKFGYRGDIFYAQGTNPDSGGIITILPESVFANTTADTGEYYNPNLVGGEGTAFSLDVARAGTGMQYAKIDGLNGAPGYLTSSAPSDQLLSRLRVANAAFVNVSVDGTDIPANEYWTTAAEKALLEALITEAEGFDGTETDAQVNDMIARLNAGINAYELAKKAGKAPSAFTVNSEKTPTYNAYRLFNGDVDNIDGKNVMSGITMGPGVDATALRTFLATKGYAGDNSPQNMAEFVAAMISKDVGAPIPTEEFLPLAQAFSYDLAEQYATNYPGSNFDPTDGDPYLWIEGQDLYADFLAQTQDEQYEFLTAYGYTGINDPDAMSQWMRSVSTGITQATYPSNYDAVNAEGFAIVNSDAFAMDLAKWVKANVQPVTSVQAGNRLQGDEGYYLLVNASVPAGWAGTAPIWVPLGGQPVQITEKVSVPTLNKQVRENSLVDPEIDNWKSRGTSAVLRMAQANGGFNLTLNITGLNSGSATPVSVTTRYGAVLPIENGVLECGMSMDADPNDGAVTLTFGPPLPSSTRAVSTPVEVSMGTVADSDEWAYLWSAFLNNMGIFNGGLPDTGVDPGTSWIITYDDGETVEIFPDGCLDNGSATYIETSRGIIVTAPINDPAPTDPSWGKAADAQTEEAVPYKLIATLPSNYSSFASYQLTFEDQLPTGIYPENIRVKVLNGETQANAVDITDLVTANNGTVAYDTVTRILTVNIPNLKAAYLADKGIVANSHIVVEYDGVLLGVIEHGTTPNVNSATLTYTADPVDLTARATSQSSSANLHTYEALFIKTDSNTLGDLAGAEFTIMRDGKYVQPNGSLDSSRYVFRTKVAEKTITAPMTNFFVSGLDAGVYTISEVTPPSGYEQLAGDLTLTITRTLNQETGAISNLAATLTGGPTGTGVEITTVINNEGVSVDDVIVLTIPNTKELVMPITGLTGNAVFYAIAGLLAVIALVGFIVSRKNSKNRKRKAAEKKE